MRLLQKSLIFYYAFFLLLCGGFFLFPARAWGSEDTAAHRTFVQEIIRFYSVTATARLTPTAEEAIVWGAAHEGISSRTLHHADPVRWLHDTEQQSFTVYEGVYAWEQGLFDFAAGNDERAFATLGHVLHLFLDAHAPLPSASSNDPQLQETLSADHATSSAFATIDDAFTPSPQVRVDTGWRAAVGLPKFSSSDARTFLLRGGADVITLFLKEAVAARNTVARDPTALVTLRPRTRSDMPRIIARATAQYVRDGFVTLAARVAGGVAWLGSRVATAFAPPVSFSAGGVSPFISSPIAIASALATPRNTGTPVLPREPLLPIARSLASMRVADTAFVTEAPILPPVATPENVPLLPPVVSPSPASAPQFLPIAPPASSQPPPVPLDDFWTYFGSTPRSRDRTPPDTTLTASPASFTAIGTATFTFTAHDASDFFCALDGGTPSACTAPRTYNNLADGAHTFSVYARDLAGNDDPTPASATWTIDRTAPDTTVTQSPNALVNTASATFVFSATEQNATFGMIIDGGGWQPVPSPFTLTALADGVHTVTIRAIDLAGNADPSPVTVTWTVDTTAPPIPLLTSPTTDVVYTTILSSLTLAGTREAGATITVNGVTDGVTTPTATTWQRIIALPLGATIVTVVATDAAGNASAPATCTITRTTNQPPTAVTTLAITSPVLTADRMTLTWMAVQDADSALANLTYDLRYATTPMTNEASWSAATSVENEPAVAAAGAAQNMTVTGLAGNTRYYFSLRIHDEESFAPLSNVPSATTVWGGTITGATTWALAASPIVVGGDLTMQAALTIDPGVVVKLARGTNMIITTSLSSIGTSLLPILFTSLKDDTQGGDTNGDGAATTPAAGDFGSIIFNTGSNGIIQYTTIEYGDPPSPDYTGTGVVRITNATVSMDHVTVANNNHGIETHGAATTLTITNAAITGNTVYNLWNNPANSGTVNWVQIQEAHFQGGVSTEYIVIKNEGSGARDLTGWKLHDAATTPNTYTFDPFTLAAGATVTVHTGSGTNTATDLYWGRGVSVWNDGGDSAFLKDNTGILLDKVSW